MKIKLKRLIGVVICVVLIEGCIPKNCKYKGQKVVSVGGCDEYGRCGVELDSGVFTRAKHPVVGMTMCPDRKDHHGN